jgi:hypothetical protein
METKQVDPNCKEKRMIVPDAMPNRETGDNLGLGLDNKIQFNKENPLETADLSGNPIENQPLRAGLKLSELNQNQSELVQPGTVLGVDGVNTFNRITTGQAPLEAFMTHLPVDKADLLRKVNEGLLDPRNLSVGSKANQIEATDVIKAAFGEEQEQAA